MPKVKVLGISRKKGVYQDNDYDNVMIHSTFVADGMIAGDAVKAYKLKTAKLLDAFADSGTPSPIKDVDDLKQLVGHTIRIIPDDYGNVDEVMFIK